MKGHYSEAIEACENALALERYSDEFHRRLMLYRYCSGEQGLALERVSKLRQGAGRAAERRSLAGVDPAQGADRGSPRARGGRGTALPQAPPPFEVPLLLEPDALRRVEKREYALLAGRLREAMEGEGTAVALQGEAGVGKTRLAEEFLGYARTRGVRVLSGRCYERELGPPLEPVIDALEPLPGTGEAIFDIHPVRSPATVRALTPTRSPESTGRSPQSSYGNRSTRIATGLILFVDDVQWADPATLDSLFYLARRVAGERILLLFTYRREDTPGLSGWLDRLSERRALSTLGLNRLLPKDVAELLDHLASGDCGGLPALADFLYRESEGNPFYAVEYLRWLIESGVVVVNNRRRISGVDTAALQESTLPSGVLALIRARLNSLDEDSLDLLGLAAVVGRPSTRG